MPYLLLKKDGVRQTTSFVFTEDEVYELSRDPPHRYTVQNTTTCRSKTVGRGPIAPKRMSRAETNWALDPIARKERW